MTTEKNKTIFVPNDKYIFNYLDLENSLFGLGYNLINCKILGLPDRTKPLIINPPKSAIYRNKISGVEGTLIEIKNHVMFIKTLSGAKYYGPVSEFELVKNNIE